MEVTMSMEQVGRKGKGKWVGEKLGDGGKMGG